MEYLIRMLPDGRPAVVRDNQAYALQMHWSELFTVRDPLGRIGAELQRASECPVPEQTAPIGASQEVWAFGVTYKSSEMARRAESTSGGDFYGLVYTAQRPELFYKGNARRVAPDGSAIRIRADSKWDVPEPELVIAVNRFGEIIGYTVGNDVSSRSIEGENPLYLPQAKVWQRSTALGPALLVTDEPLAGSTVIEMVITRAGATVFTGQTTLGAMKRSLPELASYLFLEDEHPEGVLALTGTGIVPPDEFTLSCGDVVTIGIERIGRLTNTVTKKGGSDVA